MNVLQNWSTDIEEFYPDYVQLLVDFKDKVFFQKQLFLNEKTHPEFPEIFTKARQYSEEKTARLWLKNADLMNLPVDKMKSFFLVVRETMFTRINYDTFTVENLYTEVIKVNSSFKFLIDEEAN